MADNADTYFWLCGSIGVILGFLETPVNESLLTNYHRQNWHICLILRKYRNNEHNKWAHYELVILCSVPFCLFSSSIRTDFTHDFRATPHKRPWKIYLDIPRESTDDITKTRYVTISSFTYCVGNVFCCGYGLFTIVNALRPRSNGLHFADDTFKCIFLSEKFAFGLKLHWNLFLRFQLTIFQHWLR